MSSVMPDQALIKFKYFNKAAVSATATSFLLAWRGNAPYDPEVSWGGGGCSGWNEWQTFYKNYICYGSKITLIAYNLSGTVSLDVYLVPSLNTTLVTNESVPEVPYSRWGQLSLNVGQGAFKKFKNYMSTKKMFYGKPIDSDVDFQAAMTGNPVNQWYWLFSGNINTGTAYNVQVSVKIEYYVKLYGRVDLTYN